MLPHVMHHRQRFLPSVLVGGSCVPIWVGLPYPPLEVFITDVCVTSGLVTLYHLLHPGLFQNAIIYREGSDMNF